LPFLLGLFRRPIFAPCHPLYREPGHPRILLGG